MKENLQRQKYWLIGLSVLLFSTAAALIWFRIGPQWLGNSLIVAGGASLVRAFMDHKHFDDQQDQW